MHPILDPSETQIQRSYDAAARSYAAELSNELDHKPLDRHLLSRFCEDIAPQGLVLDLGSGPGHVARFMARSGATPIGIDISAEMVLCAREMNPELEFRQGDMTQLDFENGSFAGIVSFYSTVKRLP